MAYVYDYTALTTGLWRWNISDPVGTPTVVTYSFLDNNELPDFYESPPAVGGAWNNYYVTLTASQRAATRVALGEYEANSGLRFVEVSDPSQASLQFHGNRSDHLTSWAYYPITPTSAGDVRAESSFVTLTYDPSLSWSSDVSRGGSLFTIILHEVGHAIGLQHPHEGVILAPSLDSHDNTIMSYNWDWEGDASGRARDTLGRFDIQAIKYLYGGSAGYTVSWQASGQYLLVDGGAGHDRIVTGRAASLMLGGDGNDRLSGMQFNDTLRGGIGRDRLDGAAGNDRLEGWHDSDTITGGAGADTIFGGNAGDRLSGEVHNDRIMGEAGNDTIIGGYGNDWLSGGPDHDRMEGWHNNDTLLGGSGDDTMLGGVGEDRLQGDDGHDSLLGEEGNDLLLGGGGNDFLSGLDGSDRLEGASGHDTLLGGIGANVIFGGAGNDTIFGQDGNDWMNGGADRDYLSGGTGDDVLEGAGAGDTLMGDAGDDRLNGGAGIDRLWGGVGADIFIFQGRVDEGSIHDWQDGIDRIMLRGRPGYESFDDVHGVQRGTDVVIRLDPTSVIVLASTDLASLDASDFIF